MKSRKLSSSSSQRPVRAKVLVSQLVGESNPLKRKMLLVGYITDRLEKLKQSVFLVGGQAVEAYTGGQFTTGDIDLSTTSTKAVEKLLKGIGFERTGMVWFNERLGLAVHLLGPSRRLQRPRVLEVGVYEVRLVGVEELIVDRLAAAKFWKTGDLEVAKVLLRNFESQIDFVFLEYIAGKAKVQDFLRKARRVR